MRGIIVLDRDELDVFLDEYPEARLPDGIDAITLIFDESSALGKVVEGRACDVPAAVAKPFARIDAQTALLFGRYAAGLRRTAKPSTGSASAAGTALPDQGPEHLVKEILFAYFKANPSAFSISTSGFNTSRYIAVNQAYLDLVGDDWDNIEHREMVSSEHVIDDEGRLRRLERLIQAGSYVGETASVRHLSGEIVPVRLSACRVFAIDQLYDVELLDALADPE
ncbi:MAG: hypothetical protein RLZZ444_3373 [Pseudomonadota bacterium]